MVVVKLRPKNQEDTDAKNGAQRNPDASEPGDSDHGSGGITLRNER